MKMEHQIVFDKVQTALPSCIGTKGVKTLPLIRLFEDKVPESVKCCVEVAIRDYALRNICQGDDTDLLQLTGITKVCIEVVRSEITVPTLPVLVLSDAFECLTIAQCEELFTFVESQVAVWKEELFFGPCKNYVLRMCNDVLRRLSRSQNTVFCGRILLFLARFFPFSERSGLNLISEFNLENVTSFTNMESMELDGNEGEEKMNADGKTRPSLDYTLYTKFWALQDFFRNPPQCFQKAPWTVFITYTTDVLEAFTSFKLDSEPTSQKSSASPAKVARMDSDSNQIDNYFAKYLTNQKLLDLQFSDSNFRRYLLVQMLILIQYLTANVKFKQESMSDEQLKWTRATEEKVCTLLAETPPDGQAFVTTVKHILKREDKWNDWKNNGCPEIKKISAANAAAAAAAAALQNGKAEEAPEETEKKPPAKKPRVKRKLGDLVKDADSKKKFIMGNNEMTRLWNLCPDNFEAVKSQQRDFVPSLETYFNPAIEQLMAKTATKATDRIVNDGNFGWRGLRLLACRSPHFFTHSASLIATLPEYLATMIKKIAKDMPQTSVTEEENKIAEDEEKPMQDVTEDTEMDKAGMEEETPEEENGVEREEEKAITDAEQKDLAFNVSKLGDEKWKVLANKLGFQKDEIAFIDSDKTSVEERAAFLLQLWVENEASDANKATLLYILEGLHMSSVAEGVFS